MVYNSADSPSSKDGAFFKEKEPTMFRTVLSVCFFALLGVSSVASAQSAKIAAAPGVSASDPRLADLNGKSCQGRYKVDGQGYYNPDAGVLKLGFTGNNVHVEFKSDFKGYEDRGMSALEANGTGYTFKTTTKRGISGSVWQVTFVAPLKLQLDGRTTVNGMTVAAFLDCS